VSLYRSIIDARLLVLVVALQKRLQYAVTVAVFARLSGDFCPQCP
jgi:hypothetical protein